MRKNLGRRGVLVVVVVAVASVTAGIAWAAIPTNGTITGCFTKNGGALRVIDAQTANCSSKEQRLDWNVQGAKGDTGATGATGATGSTGATGPSGSVAFGLVRVVIDGTFQVLHAKNLTAAMITHPEEGVFLPRPDGSVVRGNSDLGVSVLHGARNGEHHTGSTG